MNVEKNMDYLSVKPAYNALRFLKNTTMDKLYRLNLNDEIKKQKWKK